MAISMTCAWQFGVGTLIGCVLTIAILVAVTCIASLSGLVSQRRHEDDSKVLIQS